MPYLDIGIPPSVYSPTIGLPPRTTGQRVLYAAGLTLATTVLGGFLGMVAVGAYNAGCKKGNGCRALRAQHWVKIGAVLGGLVGVTVGTVAAFKPQPLATFTDR